MCVRPHVFNKERMPTAHPGHSSSSSFDSSLPHCSTALAAKHQMAGGEEGGGRCRNVFGNSVGGGREAGNEGERNDGMQRRKGAKGGGIERRSKDLNCRISGIQAPSTSGNDHGEPGEGGRGREDHAKPASH